MPETFFSENAPFKEHKVSQKKLQTLNSEDDVLTFFNSFHNST